MDRDYVSRVLREIKVLRTQREKLMRTSHDILGERKIKRKRKHRREMAHEVNLIKRKEDRLEDEINEYLSYYMQPECRKLCNQMQKKLPRELRDMVYESLLGKQKYFIRDDHKSMAKVFWEAEDSNDADEFRRVGDLYITTSKSKDPAWMRSFRELGFLHVFDNSSADPITKREAAESFYRLSTFVTDYNLAIFLASKDHFWCTQFQAMRFIRTVVLRMGADFRNNQLRAWGAQLAALPRPLENRIWFVLYYVKSDLKKGNDDNMTAKAETMLRAADKVLETGHKVVLRFNVPVEGKRTSEFTFRHRTSLLPMKGTLMAFMRRSESESCTFREKPGLG